MAIKLKRKSICRRRFKYSAHILAENAVFKVRIYTEYLELLRATSSASDKQRERSFVKFYSHRKVS